jgi:hypothetical protein
MSDIELPAPAFVIEVNDEPNMPVYTADQMRAAIKLEREAILAAIDDIEEPRYTGYENPNTFQDGKWAAMDAIRSRTANQKEST